MRRDPAAALVGVCRLDRGVSCHSESARFVALGIISYGWRVIQTMGSELTTIDFHVGYCVEFASTLSVVIATVIGLPVSSTHCQVGAVVSLGAYRFGRRGTNWRLFGKIALSWVCTLPFAGVVAAAMTAAARAMITR